MQSSKEKRAFWSKHIKQWNKSGLTQAGYCEQENIKPHQFFYWKGKVSGKNVATETVVSSGFTAVSVLPITSCEGLTLSFSSGVQLSGINESNIPAAKKMVELLK